MPPGVAEALPHRAAPRRGRRRRRRPARGRAAEAAWNTYIWVQDADETAAKVRAAGGTVLTEPGDVGDAGRMAVFADPEGAAFSVWQPARHRGAAVVNEHGSLNFNDLTAATSTRARAFYGAVFGWEAIDIGERPRVGAARLRRLPRAAHPGNAREHGRDGRAGALRGRRREPHPASPRTSRTPPRIGA